MHIRERQEVSPAAHSAASPGLAALCNSSAGVRSAGNWPRQSAPQSVSAKECVMHLQRQGLHLAAASPAASKLCLLCALQ